MARGTSIAHGGPVRVCTPEALLQYARPVRMVSVCALRARSSAANSPQKAKGVLSLVYLGEKRCPRTRPSRVLSSLAPKRPAVGLASSRGALSTVATAGKPSRYRVRRPKRGLLAARVVSGGSFQPTRAAGRDTRAEIVYWFQGRDVLPDGNMSRYTKGVEPRGI